MLAITHYTRLLRELHPDRVHVLWRGRIVESGGPELADDLETTGYARWTGAAEEAASARVALEAGDPDADPFADPLA